MSVFDGVFFPPPLCLCFFRGPAALQCMRRKGMFEKQIEQHTNQLFRLEEQLIQLETSKATAEVFQSMKAVNTATRTHLRNARMDEFDQVLDNVQEAQDEISEINEALGRPIGPAQEQDDDRLLAELDELEARDQDIESMEPTSSGGDRMNTGIQQQGEEEGSDEDQDELMAV